MNNIISIFVIILCTISLEANSLSKSIASSNGNKKCPENHKQDNGSCKNIRCRGAKWLQMKDECITPEACPVEGENRDIYNECVICKNNEYFFVNGHRCLKCSSNKVPNAAKNGCTKCKGNETANAITGTCDRKGNK